MQDGNVEFEKRPVAPERLFARGVQSKHVRDLFGLVVTVRLPEVARDFRLHEPAVERDAGILEAADVHAEIGDGRDDHPFQAQ